MSVNTDSSNARPLDAIAEARRQLEVCNACRYCEGFCSVFPAMTRQKAFADGDITHLANLCHNCRGCFYSCQYTPPHEFDLNIPAALGNARQESWSRFAFPSAFGKLFHERGVAVLAAVIVVTILAIWLVQSFPLGGGEGFYAFISHNVMISIFIPAFVFPFFAIAVGLRRYWRETGGKSVGVSHLIIAFKDAATLRNLDGGQGQGCNFEKTDRYSDTRRYAHQATMYGFLLCFAATTVATLMHYILDMPAPYSLLSLPKILGLTGGVLLCLGTAKLAYLKTKADATLGPSRVWGGEMAFILLLFFVSATGLVLYFVTGTTLVEWMLPLHLASVFTFFLLTPYSKMAHGFYRLAALVREAQLKR
ncbi:tricarballylate utilization 4Fe-4S protein TcuB [Hwanghaeella grinnelliae]|uniref:Tricarballylate utilization 4Fe-4S protein TcuB n=1 Tax=Hwanghaeella grinnelliae TaxID=2500179 RepID=A0A437QTF7_9PROT|nr:tricarballylate utilization 4Fe-4S protein TcuB [Hwanghaeella grinnelliae]RVU37774.1 tricarballylate utilization 4Fe-4S protein TcuB [Hwanghaeella grinnelliae]